MLFIADTTPLASDIAVAFVAAAGLLLAILLSGAAIIRLAETMGDSGDPKKRPTQNASRINGP